MARRRVRHGEEAGRQIVAPGPDGFGQRRLAAAAEIPGLRIMADQDGQPDIGKKRHQPAMRSEEHTSELQSLMRNSYAVFCLKKKKKKQRIKYIRDKPKEYQKVQIKETTK